MTTNYRINPEPVLAQPQTLQNVLDYISASYYINSKLGYDQRDCSDHFNNLGTTKYQDYWHYFTDRVSLTGNDSYNFGIDFKEIYKDTLEAFGNDDWRTKVAKVWAETYPDDDYTLWLSW